MIRRPPRSTQSRSSAASEVYKRQALATTAAAGAAYLYLRRKNYAPLPTVPHVELDRYLGRWYEVARLPVPFEKNCEHVTAEYSRRGLGLVALGLPVFFLFGRRFGGPTAAE